MNEISPIDAQAAARKARRQRIAADRALLAAAFPKAFMPKGAPTKLPLAIGIDKALFTRGVLDTDGNPVSRRRIRDALGDYVNGPKYSAALLAGGPRYDLDGNPVGDVERAGQLRAIFLGDARKQWDRMEAALRAIAAAPDEVSAADLRLLARRALGKPLVDVSAIRPDEPAAAQPEVAA